MSKEDELSHRGLFKLANAKLDLLIDLMQVEQYERKNGETVEIAQWRADANEKYKNRRKQIFTNDKLKGVM